MKILELELSYFKGVTTTLDFQGRDASIYGDNATGKTTIMDAFIWLLTGKDHLGRSELNFNIKTLADNGEVIPFLDHSVRAVLDHGGVTFELVRTFKEVWQKKTGTNVKVFNGHTTEYAINDVPKSKAEYDAFVEQIAPMEAIYLLTMTGYFNEQIKDADRRKMLLDMCGDVDDSAILALPEFAELAPHINRMVSVSDLKKTKQAQKGKINDEIKSIPVQINVHRSYMEVGGLSLDEEITASLELASALRSKEAAIADLDNGGKLAQLKKELAELETEKANYNTINSQGRDRATADLRDQIKEAQTRKYEADTSVRNIELQIKSTESLVSQLEGLRQKELDKYHELSDLEYSGDDHCPACGQPLPADQISEAVAKFNQDKAERLEQTVAAGKKWASDLDETRGRLTIHRQDLSRCMSEQLDAGARVKAIQMKIDDIMNAPAPAFDNSRIVAKQAEIDKVKDAFQDLRFELESHIDEIKSEKSGHDQNIAKLQNAKRSAKEIATLEAREKELANAYEECEMLISLCDDFTNAKVKMLDEKISGAFRFARFKLTETLVNGGLREICETLVNGVPYSAANNAARINIGLDIIETFSVHYGITLPIFVDNAEAVTRLNPMDCTAPGMDKPQVIRLVVSELDKALRLEVS